MTTLKIFAPVLIADGVFGLVYEGFSYTKESHTTKVGSLEISLQEKERVNIPVGAGAGAIVAGAVLLLVGRKA